MKSTEFEFPLAELIRNRKSIRSFDRKTIEPEKIYSLFEAARWAPSSSNEQPWMFVYASREDQSELWQMFFDCLNEGNKIWAANAPLLMLSLSRKTFQRNGIQNTYASYDLGAATAFMALQAADLGLQLRQIGGYSPERASELLHIPADLDQGAMIAVGYPGSAETLPEKLRMREQAPRERVKQSLFTRNKPFEK